MSIDGKHSYRFGYLKSDQCLNVRLEALVREQGKCQICDEESISNDAHHIWYPENIYETAKDHLVNLCRPCHDFVHLMTPECKTNDEQEGRAIWAKFSGAIALWRAKKEYLFDGSKFVPVPMSEPLVPAKELREELKRVKALLASGSPDLQKECRIKRDVDINNPEEVISAIRKWSRAYSSQRRSAESVDKLLDSSDYQI